MRIFLWKKKLLTLNLLFSWKDELGFYGFNLFRNFTTDHCGQRGEQPRRQLQLFFSKSKLIFCVPGKLGKSFFNRFAVCLKKAVSLERANIGRYKRIVVHSCLLSLFRI